MKTPPTPLRAALPLLGVALLLASAALAQTPPAAKPGSSAATEEPIVLSEFNVTGTDDGWRAANSFSGTRTNTALKELPRSVQVITSEFLADLGALTLTEATDYMSGITNVGGQSQTNDNNTYQVRGFRQNKLYRDGVREPFAGMVSDVATSDRIEVLKGPSSLLAGISEPGGMINNLSAQARSTRQTSARVLGDSWGMRRGEIDTSVPLSDNLKSRLILVRQEGDVWQQFGFSNRSVLYGTATYKLAKDTVLRGSIEYIQFLENPPQGATAVFLPTATAPSPLIALTPGNSAVVNGVNLNGVYIPWDFNPKGPEDRRAQWQTRSASQFEHRFNSWLSLRLSGNYGHMHRDDRRHQPTNITTKTVSGVVVPDRITWTGTNDDEVFRTYDAQGDLLAKFNYFGISHQAILGLEYIDSDDIRVRDNTPALAPYIFGADTQPGWAISDLALYTVPNTRLHAHARRRAVSFTNIFAFFQDRAHLMLGTRHDEGTIINVSTLAATPIGRYQKILETGNSPTAGVMYEVVKDVSVYTSTSRSFQGVPTSSIDPYGNPLSAQVSGKGKEIGLKTSFWGNRISFNAAAFDISQENQTRQLSTQDIINLGLDPLVVTGARSVQDISSRSRGWESDVIIQPFAGYQISANYTHLHAFVAANKASPASVGGPLVQGPGVQWGSLFQKYEFGPGPLKGLWLTYGVVARDNKRPATNPVGIGFTPGYARQDVGVGYRFTAFGHKSNLSVRVNNLADQRYMEGFQNPGAPRTYSFSLETKF